MDDPRIFLSSFISLEYKNDFKVSRYKGQTFEKMPKHVVPMEIQTMALKSSPILETFANY